jgi:short-chain fatty acids transporter
MVRSMAAVFSRIMQRWMPDAFVFAIILTLIVLISGISFEQQSINQMVGFWGSGVWKLLAFSMQMVFILVTGHILANTLLVKGFLVRIATLANSPSKAIAITSIVATSASWFNWGFGLVVGALIAREIAKRNNNVSFPLLVSAAYAGFIVWHAGLSGSIPLKIASPQGDALGALLNNVAIPVSDTIFSTPILLIVALLVISMPVLFIMMSPKPGTQTNHLPPIENEVKVSIPKHNLTPAQKLEHSPVLTLLLAVIALFYVVNHFISGGTLGLNIINLILLSLGLILQRSPANYLNALDESINSVGGIVLQFPLYAGIMGMMTSSGLAVSISEWFVSISTPTTFPLYTFLSAGIVNFFVPSGGGQWALQAPIVIPAAQSLGVPLNQAAMAVAFGDAWTNLIQPFWALPLLGIAGLKIKDIMGYCTVALLWSGLVIGCGLILFY